MLGEFGGETLPGEIWHSATPTTFLAKLVAQGGRRARFGTPGRGFGKPIIGGRYAPLAMHLGGWSWQATTFLPRAAGYPKLMPHHASPRCRAVTLLAALSPRCLAAAPFRLTPSRLAASSSSSSAFHHHRQNPPPSFHFNPRDADDIYAELFGFDDSATASSLRGAFSSRKATPIENALPCSLEDLYKGVKKKMKISRNVCDAFE
ncbi:hypothetical protein Fmac_033028 [Flemingia macrophylla]|uniref:Uncharacterized protein n=1 Tax=Flemingia macrophylla TaxID=520843 RepID=A0ABD1L6L3_9FABA